MSTLELLSLLSLAVVIWYWFDGLRAREVAVMAGRQLCQRQGLNFLDDSVAQTKIRLRRNNLGHIVFYREFHFEFSSDGIYRYKGKIYLMGKRVVSTEMEAYRQP